ncbi:MAG: hypothetical protein KZQ78_11605, partial [Candidatus Thiodiazotropha sp. (ex Ustalcina ferruginea)]|nr:hypothetical protein [Candidatus Thiodiazotropha sp. (ex Ustalcina ferruginea)]
SRYATADTCPGPTPAGVYQPSLRSPGLVATVLSRAADDRTVQCKDNKGSLPGCAAGNPNPTAIIPKGTPVGCGLCHRQKK